MKAVALSSGKAFSSIFPNVVLNNRAERKVTDQEDSGYPRFDGEPNVLVEFANNAVMAYAEGSTFLLSDSDNEASRVLQFTSVVQVAAKVAKADATTKIGTAELVLLTDAAPPSGDLEGGVGSNKSSPDKLDSADGSRSPATPKVTPAEEAKSMAGNASSLAESNLDVGYGVFHEYKHGDILKDSLTEKSHTELVVTRIHPDKGRILRGALELSKNLADPKNFQKKKEQVPCTAVLLNVANFDKGVMDRRTYVVSADGGVGFGCCFEPKMEGVVWIPKKMKGKDIKGEILYSAAFELFSSLNKQPGVPFQATKSTLYGFEVMARLLAPDLASMENKESFWQRLQENEEANLTTAVSVLEPMFEKPSCYEGITFKGGKHLPPSMTAPFTDGFRARECATEHLRSLATHYERISAALLASVKKREEESAQYVQSRREEEFGSMTEEEFEQTFEAMRSRRKKQKV